ncbi:MAG: protein translocase subunit SecD [Verrucomicrobiota bacterium]|nr:protein translocase subunit SecD [Verrucomicrobiota bacterium]
MQPTFVFLSGLVILALLFWYLASDDISRKRKVGTTLIAGIVLLCIWSLAPRSENSEFRTGDLIALGDGYELTVEAIAATDKKGEEIEMKQETLDARLRTLQERLQIDGKGATYSSSLPRTIIIRMPGFSKAEAEEVKAKVIAKQQVGSLKPGIDLAGGASFTLQVQPKVDQDAGETIEVTSSAIQQAVKTLQGRLNPDGTKDMLIQPQGEDMIIIEMPGVSEEEAAWVREIIQKQSVLELRAVHTNNDSLAPQVAAKETAVPGYRLYTHTYTNDRTGDPVTEQLLLEKRNKIEGKHVKKAFPDQGSTGVVRVELSNSGGKLMRNLTAPMRKGSDRLAIVLDGEINSAPVVQATLSSIFVIEGIGDAEECRNLSATLMNPLENPLKILKESTVTARLGAATVSQGIYAGIAGLALTLVFLIIYYRIAGFIALIGLTINVLILFGAMAMFEFTFTLPGIAGIILTIGVAVDANVLIYERLREELQAGKSLGTAIQAAYEKAFTAIFDANITTLITAIILFWRASGTVKGFAITLTIGILASMFAALVVTRVVFWWTARGPDKGVRKLTFLNMIPKRTINFMGLRKAAFAISLAGLAGSFLMVGTKREEALGIDFAGGALIQFQTQEERVQESDASAALEDLDLKKVPIIQNETLPAPDNSEILSIRCADEDAEQIVNTLREKIPSLSLKKDPGEQNPASATGEDGAPGAPWKYDSSRDTVEASLGADFLVNSLIALGIGLVGILLYITIRFEFSFAVGAFAALFHDVLICIGIVVLAGQELSLIHVGAFLTIAGYSINDTIVVFDRIRETLRTKRGEVDSVMNLAINATLARTILTSLTTFMAVLVLYIFGGASLKAFSFAIMIGVIVGTYSSIFVASPIVLIWSRIRGTNLRRELLDANLEAQVNPGRG